MITSITIVSSDNTRHTIRNTDTVRIVSDSCVSVGASNDTITISADSRSLGNTPYAALLSQLISGVYELPYLTKISGVGCDSKHNIWLLGGKTSQVDSAGEQMPENGSANPVLIPSNAIYITDMGQTVDYPRIYSSVYAMLRQLRLWIDAHKDTILLNKGNAETWWDTMKQDPDDWYPKEKDGVTVEYYTEGRSRSSISSIGHATNFLSAYWAVIGLWNYIVNRPLANVTTRLHPADQAGIYVGVDMNIPRYTDNELNLTVVIKIDITTEQDTTNMRLWVRMPMRSCIPEDPGVSFGDLSVSSSIIDVETGESVLDSGIHTAYPEAGSLQISYPIKMAAKNTSSVSYNLYTLQNVVEVIPYMVCDYDKEETGSTTGLYSTAKKSPRSAVSGETVWTVSYTVYQGEDIISQVSEQTKKTTYAAECVEDIESTENTEDSE